ncbi:type III-B CRISPR module RAMP protein Cmr1 [Rubrobacter naiadicus]|uniref:type III-B CRISPR module RAMP protein Cmr1 n=1 Tax=Rubrobacter naiadicus TaxID=1392641 RepID=UPI00235E59E6|nr:type III-B CRISPR module RAMP protein Cmr1 [Rubrobacter naiadicus]
MEKIEATFRVVTPMFMSGADQSKAELRLPSIKGALRFWWRALAWSRYGDLEKIREEEARLFGNTDEGQSKVLMRLTTAENLESFLGKQEAKKWGPNTWQGYVGYGLVDRKLRPTRQYIRPGFTFSLLISARDRRALEEMESPLKALGLLGGLGGRSRKSWGSLTLMKMEGIKEWAAPKNEQELRKSLENLLQSEHESGRYTGISNGTAFAIGKTYPDAAAAQGSLAQTYRDFLKALGGGNKTLRETFGLPRQLGMRGNRYKNANERRASPIFLHIHEFPDRRAVPVVTLLPGRFLSHQSSPSGGWQTAQRFLNKV